MSNMNKHQENIIDLILNDEEFRNYLREESERTKRRIEERMNKREAVPYIRVGNEEQLEKLDQLFAKALIDEAEYVRIRRRLRGDRNA